MVFVSGASIWEATLEVKLGRRLLQAQRFVDLLQAAGIEKLPVTWNHSLAVQGLPVRHRDPFDRLLVSQAPSGPMGQLTHDAVSAACPDRLVVV